MLRNILRHNNSSRLIPLLRPSARVPIMTRCGIRTPYMRFYSERRPPPHTKEQLLAQSRHFLDSLKIRFKWALIRQNRPFNMDEISAFVSWIVMGNLLWLVIGTTTFVGLVFYSFDTFLNNQSARNRAMLKLLKFDTRNLQISIDKNFKLGYKDGRLIFNNVTLNNFEVQKICLSLSFQKWQEGRGMIKDLEINGLRGNLEINDYNDFDLTNYFQSKDYELESFVIKDSLINFNGKNKLQIFYCELDKLRSQWLLYDFFNCDNCNGAINDSLFTIHTKQINRNYASFEELEKINVKQKKDEKVEEGFALHNVVNFLFLRKPFDMETKRSQVEVQKESLNKILRFRIDELDLSQISKPENFKWIDSGKIELIADITFPQQDSTRNNEFLITLELKSLITGLYDKITNKDMKILNNNNDNDNDSNKKTHDTPKREYVMIDFKLQFKDLKLNYSQSQLDPELIKFINNYNPDQSYQLISTADLDSLIMDENTFSILDQHDYFQDHHDEILLPPINFRIIKNVQQLSIDDLNNTVSTELVNNLNSLKYENDTRVKRYKDGSYLIKNLILIGLGVCLI